MHHDKLDSASGVSGPTDQGELSGSVSLMAICSPPKIEEDADVDMEKGSGRPQCAAPSESSCKTDNMHQFIREERRRSFCFLGKHSHQDMDQEKLLVVAPATSDDIRVVRRRDRDRLLEHYDDNHFFTLVEPQTSRSLKRTVVITFECNQSHTIENLTITELTPKRDSESMPASAWLRKTYNDTETWSTKPSECQNEEQRLWWDSNGKSFRFMHLPPELQQMAILQMIGPVVVPDLYKSGVILGKGLAYEEGTDRIGYNRDPDIKPPNMAIMLVNKAMYRDATLVAHRDTFKRFRFVGLDRSSATVQPCKRAPIIMDAINAGPIDYFLCRVQLEMCATHAFASALEKPGRRLHAHSMISPSHYKVEALFDLRNLRYLDFCFIGPKHKDASCPYGNRALDDDGKHACQKIWINMFFTFAWATLALLKEERNVTFTLSGCVKTSSKKYWQKVLNGCPGDYAAEMDRERQRIEALLDSPAPECKCSTACSKAGAAPMKTWSAYERRTMKGLQEHADEIYWNFRD